MLLWAVLGALTALVLVALLRPVMQDRAAEPVAADAEIQLYRDQLAELDRDRERGVIGEREAAAARVEIERRLLAASPHEAVVATTQPGWRRAAALLMLVLVPAVSLGLYLALGTPNEPDAPYHPPPAPAKPDLDLEATRGALEARLTKEPDSLQGWVYLAETDAALARWPDARAAMGKALVLSNRSAEVLEADGSLLVAEADGEVTDEAASIFEEVVAKRPDSARARYDLGLAKAQRGDFAAALDRWKALEKDAPADAPWLPTLRDAIAAAGRALKLGEEPPADAPPEGAAQGPMAQMMKLPPAERGEAIKAMVAALAQRLEAHPDDLAGWKRLGRSYLVLGQPKDSIASYRKATGLAPTDAEAALGLAEALQADQGGALKPDPDLTEAWQRVAALEPDQPEALWYLGLAAKQRGDAGEAASLWRRVLTVPNLDPTRRDEITKALEALPNAK